MAEYLTEVLTWLEPHALLLALLLPPVIRVVGHWLPEEPFMIAIGVLAARSSSLQAAVLILSAVFLSHFVTDQAVYLGGRWLSPRLGRFPRISQRLDLFTKRLTDNPGALLGFLPARVLPLGRGAWLAACGVVRIPWPRFVVVDFAALILHLAVWSGLGWWMAGDLERLARSSELAKITGIWVAVSLVAAIMAVIFWRYRENWLPGTNRVMRRAGRSFRQVGRRI